MHSERAFVKLSHEAPGVALDVAQQTVTMRHAWGVGCQAECRQGESDTGLGGGVVSVDTLQTRNLATRASVGRVAGNPPSGESFHRAAID